MLVFIILLILLNGEHVYCSSLEFDIYSLLADPETLFSQQNKKKLGLGHPFHLGI